MKKAFTLIEILIIVIVISLIAIALIPRIIDQRSVARDSARALEVGQIQHWLEVYKINWNDFPAGNCISDLMQPLVTSWKVMSQLAFDPDPNRNHFGSLTWSCQKWVYVYQNLFLTWWSSLTWYVLSVNMEKYKNMNYVLSWKYDSDIFSIKNNICNQVKAWTWSCQTNDLMHSWTYILTSIN